MVTVMTSQPTLKYFLTKELSRYNSLPTCLEIFLCNLSSFQKDYNNQKTLPSHLNESLNSQNLGLKFCLVVLSKQSFKIQRKTKSDFFDHSTTLKILKNSFLFIFIYNFTYTLWLSTDTEK